MDVGQGDSALVECDGHYMLIDGGSKGAGDKVYDVLQEKGIQHLDILAFSHTHEDHVGGLPKVLTYATQIDRVLGNTALSPTNDSAFIAFENALLGINARITVPVIGERYKLGSASIEVVDVASDKENDCLVLLATYGKTRFLFTGDIEDEGQTRLSEKYHDNFKIDLMKIPHHGAYTGTLYRLFRTFRPDNVVISVGNKNRYGHPAEKTLNLFSNDKQDWKPKVYRTDEDGDIIVKSNGKELFIQTSK